MTLTRISEGLPMVEVILAVVRKRQCYLSCRAASRFYTGLSLRCGKLAVFCIYYAYLILDMKAVIV